MSLEVHTAVWLRTHFFWKMSNWLPTPEQEVVRFLCSIGNWLPSDVVLYHRSTKASTHRIICGV